MFQSEEVEEKSIGKQIANIRKKQEMTQEEFGKLFYVTRQTVSNWENNKSYPELQILVEISNRFDISLDRLLKGDKRVIKAMDNERFYGKIKHDKAVIDFFTGSGTGLIISCLFAPDSTKKLIIIVIGILLIGIGWYRKSQHDQEILKKFEHLQKEE